MGPALTSARLSIHAASDSDTLLDPLPKSHLGSWLNADSWDWAQMTESESLEWGLGTYILNQTFPSFFLPQPLWAS